MWMRSFKRSLGGTGITGPTLGGLRVLRVCIDGDNRWLFWHNQRKWWFMKRNEVTGEKIAERMAEATKRLGASDPMYNMFGTGTGALGVCGLHRRWKDGTGGRDAYYGGVEGSSAAQSSSGPMVLAPAEETQGGTGTRKEEPAPAAGPRGSGCGSGPTRLAELEAASI